MEDPASTARRPLRPPSLRRLLAWMVSFSLAAYLLIRLPHEVSYWMLALAEKASAEGRLDDALGWVEEAKQWTPDSLLPVKVAGRALQKAGKLDDLGRIDLVLQKPDLSPEDKAALHVEKSELLRQKQRWDDALAEFDKAANFKGELRPSVHRLGLLLQANRMDDAAREIEQLLKASTSDRQKLQLHLELSSIYRTQRRWEDALREFDQAAEFEPKLLTTPDHLELLLLNDKREEAKQELPALEKQLLANWQSQAITDNLMAYFLALIGDDLDQALQRVDNALAQDDDNEAYLDTRAFVLYRLHRYDDALPAAQRAVERIEEQYSANGAKASDRKNVAVIVYHRSLILEALGKSAEAEQDRARVRELGFEPEPSLF